MSLFVRHVADKQQFPVFLWRCGVFPRNLSQGISVAYLKKKTRSDHVTRNASAARNNEAYRQGNGRQSFCTVLRYIKNTGHGNCFTLAVFTLQLEMDYPSSLRLACVQSPPPPQTLLPWFFLRGGAAVHRLSETENPYPNCPSTLTDKVRWIVHSKLKTFHFQTKTYYVSDANNQTDNPSHANHPSLVWKRPFLL